MRTKYVSRVFTVLKYECIIFNMKTRKEEIIKYDSIDELDEKTIMNGLEPHQRYLEHHLISEECKKVKVRMPYIDFFKSGEVVKEEPFFNTGKDDVENE